MKIFLNKNINILLSTIPFSSWLYDKTIDEGDSEFQTEVFYEFQAHDLEIQCDKNFIIETIFIKGSAFDKELLDLDFDFSFNQDMIRICLGEPSFSSNESNSQYLGKSGAWDRFDFGSYVIHIEYKIGIKKINKITFMTLERAPKLRK
jgi:hypothetical protein